MTDYERGWTDAMRLVQQMTDDLLGKMRNLPVQDVRRPHTAEEWQARMMGHDQTPPRSEREGGEAKA